jgi:hypothetical protein
MRRPSTPTQMYRWHRFSLAGMRPDTSELDPQCGWFGLRRVRGGPIVPVEIWLDQAVDPETGELAEPEVLMCSIDGEASDLRETWPRVCGHPIPYNQYLALMQGKAGSYDPLKKVNLMKAVVPN